MYDEGLWNINRDGLFSYFQLETVIFYCMQKPFPKIQALSLLFLWVSNRWDVEMLQWEDRAAIHSGWVCAGE